MDLNGSSSRLLSTGGFARRLVQINGGIPVLREAAVLLSSLLLIGSIPALPAVLWWLFRRAYNHGTNCTEEERRQRRYKWIVFFSASVAYVCLALHPVKQRPGLMRGRLWDYWLEYLQVRVAYRGGKQLPAGQYLYAFMPHGVYPFGAAMAAVSEMMDAFPGMRMAIAPAALRVPLLRHLCLWIGSIPVQKHAMLAALKAGSSVGLVPGGIAEMIKTDQSIERLVLQNRKGFVQVALEAGVPIVPVYIFGNSLVCSNFKLPFLEQISRRMRTSLVLPHGRFGLFTPRQVSLLYAVGEPITCPGLDGKPTPEQVIDTHAKLMAAVQELYTFYKGLYGWGNRQLVIE